MPETDTMPVSASVASTGTGIRYIGDHCYAYSGQVAPATDGSQTTLLDFTSGTGYIIGQLFMNGTNNGTSGTGFVDNFELVLNGIVSMSYKIETAQEDMPSAIEGQIVIPPLTDVLVRVRSTSNNVNWTVTSSITGRVYGEK